MKLFDPEAPLMRALSGFADLIVLNVLWLLCSLPVVTLGVSTAALYTVTLRMLRQEGGGAARSFFRAFRENFRKATLLWLIFLAAAALWVVEFILCRGESAGLAVLAPFGLLFLLWVFTVSYVFPLQARFENPVGRTLQNALLMSFAHLPYTLVFAVLNTFPLWLFLLKTELFWQLSFLWLSIGFAAIAYGNSFFFQRLFRRYMPPATREEAPRP